MKVYFRDLMDGLHKFTVTNGEEAVDHCDAIDLVRQQLNQDGDYYKEPLLAVINGGRA